LLALTESSVLTLEKLNYEQQSTGELRVQTLLDLQSGDLLGHAKQLSAGSSYQIKMANGVANIGDSGSDVSAFKHPASSPASAPPLETKFYISSNKGTIHVLLGTVNLTIAFDPGGVQTGFPIPAGQSFYMPKQLTSVASLGPVPSPSKLTGLGSFTLYDFVGVSSVNVKETFGVKLIVDHKTGQVKKEITDNHPTIEVLSN